MDFRDKLILFTSGFPYGHGESFLENELPFLANSFKQIIIFSKNPDIESAVRKVPNNCQVVPLHFRKNQASDYLQFMNFGVIKELFSVIFTHNGIQKTKTLLKQVLLSSNTKRVLFQHTSNTAQQIIYSYWLDDSAISFSLIKGQYPNTKFISRAHGWDVYFERHPNNYLPLRAFLSKKLDAIFFISQNGADYFKALPNVEPNIAKLSRLGTLKTSRDHEKFSLAKPTLNLLSCSSLIPLKRIHLIIESLTQLSVPFHWYHIGTGPLEAEIHHLAEQNLSNSSYTFAGRMSNELVIQFYQSHSIDLLLNTSSTEGIPVSMMEALSFGVPCLGTNVGGVSELIEDRKNGYLVGPNPSPLEICACLEDFAKQSSEEQSMLKANALQSWDEKYNAEKNYTEFIKTILS